MKTEQYLVSPTWMIIYPIAILLDQFTTWLASPDLEYETNFIVTGLGLGWAGLLSFAILWSLIILIAVFCVNRYYKSYLLSKEKPRINWVFVVSFLICTKFYSHLISSIYVSANNYLNYVYLIKNTENFFYQLADMHIHLPFYGEHYPIIITNTSLLIGAIITILSFRKKFRL